MGPALAPVLGGHAPRAALGLCLTPQDGEQGGEVVLVCKTHWTVRMCGG